MNASFYHSGQKQETSILRGGFRGVHASEHKSILVNENTGILLAMNTLISFKMLRIITTTLRDLEVA